jgi:hypothetical protein
LRKSADSHRIATSLTGYRLFSFIEVVVNGLDLTIEGTPVLSKHFLAAPPISNPPELCGGILLRSTSLPELVWTSLILGLRILPLHPRIQFLSKSYRFFTHPQGLVANGRPQTFLGVLTVPFDQF